MKIRRTLLLVSSVMLLVSCGKTASSSILPEGGTVMENSAAAAKLTTAISGITDHDALAVSLSDFVFSLDADITTATTVDSVLSVGDTLKGSVSVNNASFFAGAKGLKSTVPNDIQAKVSMAADFAANLNVVAEGSTAYSSAVSYPGVSGAAYIANQNAYLDLSNANFVNFVNALVNALQGLSGDNDTSYAAALPASTSYLPAPGKYQIDGIIPSAEKLPLMTSDIEQQMTAVGQQIGSYLGAFSSLFTSYSYTNGNYAIDIQISKEKIISFIASNLSSWDSEANQSAVMSAVNEALDYLTIKSCEAVIVYNTTGLVSIATNIDVAVSATYEELAQLVGDYDSNATASDLRSAKESVAFVLKGKLSFLSGNDVVIDLPSDLNTYTVVNPAN